MFFALARSPGLLPTRARGVCVHGHRPWAALAEVDPSLLPGAGNSHLSHLPHAVGCRCFPRHLQLSPVHAWWGGRNAAATSASCSSLSSSAHAMKMLAHCPSLQDKCAGEDTLSHGEDGAHWRRELVLREVMYLGEPGFVGHQLVSYGMDMVGWLNAVCGSIKLCPKEETKRKPWLCVAQHHDMEANWSVWEHEGIIWWSV